MVLTLDSDLRAIDTQFLSAIDDRVARGDEANTVGDGAIGNRGGDDVYRGRRLSVLVVDDDQGLAMFVVPPTAAMGCEVRVADRTDALAHAQTAPPDVVIVGYDPCEPVGAELGRRLHDLVARRPPLVATVTNPDDPEALRRAEEPWCHLHLVRPINPTLLTGILCRFRDFLDGVEKCGRAD